MFTNPMIKAYPTLNKATKKNLDFHNPLCLFLSSTIPIPQPSIFNSSIYTSQTSKAPDSQLQINPKKPWPLL